MIFKEIISIIMPAFNSEKYIRDSVCSVLNQTYPHWVLYIINDNSSDRTVEIVRDFKDSRIRLINLSENVGVARARNQAISMCKGKYISFLDSDDFWREDKLDKQISILEKGVDIVCSNYISFYDSHRKKRMFPEYFEYNDMLKGNFIGNLTGIYNCHKLGKFFQENTRHEDYLMWLNIIKKSNNKVLCIQDELAYYRISKNSLSSNKIKAAIWQWNIYRVNLGISFNKSIYYWFIYILRSIKSRC